ncbi:hypothetical protein DMENIID0001_040590 [Sergentomyia squamirostris]
MAVKLGFFCLILCAIVIVTFSTEISDNFEFSQSVHREKRQSSSGYSRSSSSDSKSSPSSGSLLIPTPTEILLNTCFTKLHHRKKICRDCLCKKINSAYFCGCYTCRKHEEHHGPPHGHYHGQHHGQH